MSSERAYLARYVRHTIPAAIPAGSVRTLGLVVENGGTEPWPLHPCDGSEVGMAVFRDGRLIASA